MITLMPSVEQQQIVDSVVDVLRTRSVERLRNSTRAPGSMEKADWALFAELGWFSIGLPEAAGGIGYSILEELLIARELGRQVVSPTVLASTVAAHLAWQVGASDLAKAIATGATKVALALPAGSLGDHQLSASAAIGDFHVVDRLDADNAIYWNEAGAGLISLEGAALTATASIDTSISLERVQLAGIKPAAFSDDADGAFRNRAALLLSSAMVGMAEASRDLAADYAKVREQFGKPIGSFQAIAHHCANMALRAETAWVQVKFAGLALDDARADATFQVSAAVLLAAEAAALNSAMSVRVHGAMGFTAECSVHHFVKRSVLFKAAAGGSDLHAGRLLAQPQAA